MNRNGSKLTEKEEAFCQIMAREAADISDAAFRAGYRGGKNNKIQNSYHTVIGNRLLTFPRICNRINEIKEEVLVEDKNFQGTLVDRLKRVIFFNPLKYYESKNYADLESGTVKTNVYLKTQFQDWNPDDGMLVAGFDKNGMPRFIDKQWAFDKLLKIYSLDGSKQVDTEDLVRLFLGVGLPVNNQNQYSVKGIDLETGEDLDELEREADEDIEADNALNDANKPAAPVIEMTPEMIAKKFNEDMLKCDLIPWGSMKDLRKEA